MLTPTVSTEVPYQQFMFKFFLEGNLRLFDPYSSGLSSSGRLEIYLERQWGTVCDNNFNSTDADIACQQLGFAGAGTYGSVRR